MNPESLLGIDLGKGVLQHLLGQGTMGAVYLASPSQAIKVFLPASLLEKADSEEFQKCLVQIVAQSASLEHKHILSTLDYGEHNGFLYQVMPYIASGNLQKLLATTGALPFARLQLFLEQLASALDYAHTHSILHRDLKPENILLTPEGDLLLADFGLAGLTTDQNFARVRRAAPGMLNYIAPEYVLNKPLDGRADIYSLGVVLYQMVTGSVPFQNASLTEVALMHVKNVPPEPCLLRPDLPQAAAQVILRALAKSPSDRYQHAQDLASAFRLALEAESPLPVSNQVLPALATLSSLTGGTGQTRSAAPRGGGLFDPKWQTFARLPTNALGQIAAQEHNPPVLNNLSMSDQRPFAQNSLQLAEPVTSGHTEELKLATLQPSQGTTGQSGVFPASLNSGETTGTLKLAEPGEMGQMPLEDQADSFITNFPPLSPAREPIEVEPPGKSLRRRVRIVNVLLVVFILVAGSGAFFWFTHRTTPQHVQVNPNPEASATARATVTSDANIIFSDDLSQNIHNWTVGSQGSSSYTFKDGAYHITNHDKNRGAPALLPDKVLSGPFAYSLTMEQLQGNLSSQNNQFGMILDATVQNTNGKQVATFYAFEVLNKPNGQYQFWKYDNHKATVNPWTMLWSKGFGKEFLQGSGSAHINTLKVLVTGKNFAFMVNGKQVGTQTDSSFSSGNVGMLVNLNGAEVAFSNLLLTHS
ncbi:MAG TPA: serine/threonine-protein kinase [Ktedonobacteraceae bacterium]|nr:serine/threonine-protein kinase [Ktedonobacteraceae bacterium]